MTNHLDEIFSPQRLRSRWQQREEVGAKPAEPAAAPVDSQTVTEVFNRLKSLIQQRFEAQHREALNAQLDELQDLLLKRFSPAGDAEVLQEERAAIDAAIHEVLNDIEDLLEAFLL